MTTVIKLPPGNAITGRLMTRQDHYKNYQVWRKSPGAKIWYRKQWRRQDARCFYCYCDLRKVRVNIEHVTPQSRWGETSAKNLVLSCADCNKAKGRTNPSAEWVRRADKISRKKSTDKTIRRKGEAIEQLERQDNPLDWLSYERP